MGIRERNSARLQPITLFIYSNHVDAAALARGNGTVQRRRGGGEEVDHH